MPTNAISLVKNSIADIILGYPYILLTVQCGGIRYLCSHLLNAMQATRQTTSNCSLRAH